jgi:hypothetical protein
MPGTTVHSTVHSGVKSELTSLFAQCSVSNFQLLTEMSGQISRTLNIVQQFVKKNSCKKGRKMIFFCCILHN